MWTLVFPAILFIQSSFTCIPDPPMSCRDRCLKACPDSACFEHCMDICVEGGQDEITCALNLILIIFLDLVFLTNFNISKAIWSFLQGILGGARPQKVL